MVFGLLRKASENAGTGNAGARWGGGGVAAPCCGTGGTSYLSQTGRRRLRESRRETLIACAGIIVAGAAVVFGMPAASSAWLRHAGQEKTAGQCPAPRGDMTVKTMGKEGASDRAPSGALPPRNPRVSALRVLPEGLLLSTVDNPHFKARRRTAGRTRAAIVPAPRPADACPPECPQAPGGGWKSAPRIAHSAPALRLIVPRAFRLMRVV